VLLVDASNAFNSLNQRASLHNIHFTCPLLTITLTNVYREASCLFIDGECILSEEGTTLGDPLAMAMYVLSTVPLINKLEGLATRCGLLITLLLLDHLLTCWIGGNNCPPWILDSGVANAPPIKNQCTNSAKPCSETASPNTKVCKSFKTNFIRFPFSGSRPQSQTLSKPSLA